MIHKITIAPNAFKGTLTAMQAAECIARGMRQALPRAKFLKIPVADGGDGTAQAIIQATRGRFITRRVHDPLGRPLRAAFGITGDGSTAIIELPLASGLVLLKPHERNPMITSTRGTGELLRAALDHGVQKILVGIGGSATNDAATGIAAALGARFLDAKGRPLPDGGVSLIRLAHIDLSGLDPRLAKIDLEVACDVTNPLFGPHGAARVYGPQKGATPAMVKTLDAGLRRLAAVIKRDLKKDIARVPGAGAAGGSGAGLVAFLGARLRPGAQIVIDAVRLREKLEEGGGCDLVITGEGRFDSQTAHGKAPAAVAHVARSLGIPIIALCGSVASDPGPSDHLFDAIFSTIRETTSESDLHRHAAARLQASARQIARLLRAYAA